ncbi:SDR family NAD(P)-dependent oxidoreductase [Mesorhizobium sp.]|uniref:SDR family NAD(P)-dependent oxidoreductase n=1 Tax=Mesorhizobium sp. TaxID=1871066 RepID=UPI000FEA58B0|nr:SDR family NAD(P)-dependent oxidoreductase [Mesorhizobium sp.]RWL18092.1 MAG: SDR family oxidoreductase [Mesorhizobium sp.]RWM43678.1 MAG: SDR family oxidoreductase [Mesorhizobium sp.]RWM58265.1 MAG: SDR family oxidoreductase [Mesorhizobium sp.]RWM58570.1 MAG: SDR family oxidoreductase [Mesorhizobium sp.]TIO64140.1 MAG: SDR family oxidoreductase [Mesorhizobium sp.]
MNSAVAEKPVVLITGASSGIGAATAAMLARTDRVAIVGRRAEKLGSIARETGVMPLAADITDPAECERIVEQTIAAFGRLDGLVLNAGVSRSARLADMPLDEWEFVIRTNLTSAFLVAKAAIPHLLKTKGAIVSVSSLSALRTSQGFAAYSASKAGLVVMTQTIARDYGPEGLRANVVCPGWIRTEMSDMEMSEYSEATGTDKEELFRRAVEHVPARRVARPEEAAAPIVFLLSPQASYVNGAVLSVDGGAAMVDVGTLVFG